MIKKFPKILCFLLCFTLIFEQSGFAQVAGQLDISGYFAGLHNAFTQDKFRPLHLRSLTYEDAGNNFKLILDQGDFKPAQPREIEGAAGELMKYFFIGVCLPNDSFWVNLRPDSPDDIIDGYLAQTDLGKVLLEADLQLKKDTASFTSPQTPEGRDYWNKLYQKANELFAGENVSIPTLTRPWIVPGEIIIRQGTDNAYIYKATLKVMLEQDYLKGSATYDFKDERLKQLNEYASGLIRKDILPKLTRDVNTAKRYAPLRQVYYSLILAQWFKQKFSGKNGSYSHLINKRDLEGFTSSQPWSKDTYFQAYKKSFQEGEYNIKEPVYTSQGKVIRSYMSGGISFGSEASSAILQGQVYSTKGLAAGLLKNNIVLDYSGGEFKIDNLPEELVESPLAPVLETTEGKAVSDAPSASKDKSSDSSSSSPLNWLRRTALTSTLALSMLGGMQTVGQNLIQPVKSLIPIEQVTSESEAVEIIDNSDIIKYLPYGKEQILNAVKYISQKNPGLAFFYYDSYKTLSGSEDIIRNAVKVAIRDYPEVALNYSLIYEGFSWGEEAALNAARALSHVDPKYALRFAIQYKHFPGSEDIIRNAAKRASQYDPTSAILLFERYKYLYDAIDILKSAIQNRPWLALKYREEYSQHIPDTTLREIIKKAELMLEEIQPLFAKAKELNIEFPKRFNVDQLKEVVRNRELNQPDDRALAVAIYPKFDYNNSFEDNGLNQYPLDKYRLMYYEASNIKEATSYVKEAAKDQQAIVIHFGLHGSKAAMQFAKEEFLYLTDEDVLRQAGISQALVDGGQIILESCSTGEGEEDASNLANMMRRLFPQAKVKGIHAPVAPSESPRIIIDDFGEIINVTFKVGTYHARLEDFLDQAKHPELKASKSKLTNEFLAMESSNSITSSSAISSSPVTDYREFINTPEAALVLAADSRDQVIKELKRLADQVTKDYSEDDFHENVGLIIGTKEGNTYRINRLRPLTEFEEGTVADYIIPSSAEVVRVIETELRDGEQVLGDYHNHSFERLRSNQRPGPSSADAMGGGYLNIPGYEARIVSDRLGMVIEPELNLDKVTMNELANFSPANSEVIVYPYIMPNRGYERRIIPVSKIYLESLIDKVTAPITEVIQNAIIIGLTGRPGESDSASSPVGLNGQLTELQSIIEEGPSAFKGPRQRQLLLDLARTIGFRYENIEVLPEDYRDRLYFYSRQLYEIFKFNPSFLAADQKDLRDSLGSLMHDLFHFDSTFSISEMILEGVLDDINRERISQLKQDFLMLRDVITWEGFLKIDSLTISRIIGDVVDFTKRADAETKELLRIIRENHEKLDADSAEILEQGINKLNGETQYNLGLMDVLIKESSNPGGKRPFSVDESLHDIAGAFRESKLGSIDLKLDLNAGGARPHINMLRFMDACKNLIVNGIDAINTRKRNDSSPGEIIIASRFLKGNGNDVVEISFSDNGMGIPEELLKDRRIFGKGFTTKGVMGTGTGLYLVDQHVKFNGGTIDAYSDGPGKGARFVIRQPIFAQEEAGSQEMTQKAYPVSSQGPSASSPVNNMNNFLVGLEIDAITDSVVQAIADIEAGKTANVLGIYMEGVTSALAKYQAAGLDFNSVLDRLDVLMREKGIAEAWINQLNRHTLGWQKLVEALAIEQKQIRENAGAANSKLSRIVDELTAGGREIVIHGTSIDNFLGMLAGGQMIQGEINNLGKGNYFEIAKSGDSYAISPDRTEVLLLFDKDAFIKDHGLVPGRDFITRNHIRDGVVTAYEFFVIRMDLSMRGGDLKYFKLITPDGISDLRSSEEGSSSSPIEIGGLTFYSNTFIPAGAVGLNLSLAPDAIYPDLLIYGYPTPDGHIALKGGIINPANHVVANRNLLRPLLRKFFELYPQADRTSETLMIPVLLKVLMQDFGFRPREGVKPNAWLGKPVNGRSELYLTEEAWNFSFGKGNVKGLLPAISASMHTPIRVPDDFDGKDAKGDELFPLYLGKGHEIYRDPAISASSPAAQKTELPEKLRQQIEKSGGRISYADFMQTALYDDDYGYYARFVNITKDFDTDSEHAGFGNAMASQLLDMWSIMGEPSDFRIVEMGAGRGTLAKNILEYLSKEPRARNLYKNLKYIIVDVSEHLKAIQAKSVEAFPGKVEWKDLEGIEGIQGVFISSELVDAFPVHIIRKQSGRFHEVFVGFKDGSFTEELGELSTQEMKDYAQGLTSVAEGQEVPFSPYLSVWSKQVARALKRGFVITADYGVLDAKDYATHENIIWSAKGDKVKNARQQIYKLISSGRSIDITWLINFADLSGKGQGNGLNEISLFSLRDSDFSPAFRTTEVAKYLAVSPDFRMLMQEKGVFSPAASSPLSNDGKTSLIEVFTEAPRKDLIDRLRKAAADTQGRFDADGIIRDGHALIDIWQSSETAPGKFLKELDGIEALMRQNSPDIQKQLQPVIQDLRDYVEFSRKRGPYAEGELSSSPAVDTQMIESLKELDGRQVRKDGEDYKFEVQNREGEGWDRIVVLKNNRGEEVGMFELSTTSGNFPNARFIRITSQSYLNRGFARFILEEVGKVFPPGKTITTEVASQESLDEIKNKVPLASTGIVRLFESAGWEFIEGGYYDERGEYHAEPFADAINEDNRRDEEGIVVVRFKAQASRLSAEEEASSPAQDKGGIDFRALPVTAQAPAAGPALSSITVSASLLNIDPDESLLQIRNMLKAGIIPSSERVKEYLQFCCLRQGMDREMDDILSCIADILKMQEDRVMATEPSLKEMLSLLESSKTANEMRFSLEKIRIEAKEPAAMMQ